MRVVVTGGTGFIGRPLCQKLVKLGHSVIVLTRDPGSAVARLDQRVSLTGWEGAQRSSPQYLAALQGCEAIINLAGEPIAGRRWTDRVKDDHRASRIGTTAGLVSALSTSGVKPGLLISASAIGYYGPRGDETLTEESPPGAGFLASLCSGWEAAARAAEPLGMRVVLPRIGVVLGKGGGPLGKMLTLFRLGLGGPMGSGTQWISWIHRDDLVDLLVTAMGNPTFRGPVNATAPHPVTNREFASTLGRVLNRPARLPVPGFLLRLALGQMADELLLTGQRVVPQRAERWGYRFRYPRLAEAFHEILAVSR